MLLAFALAYLGMLGLCLSMSRHHKALLGGEPGRLRQRMLRWAAAICFAARAETLTRSAMSNRTCECSREPDPGLPSRA